MRVSVRVRNPFSFLFVSSKREHYLAQYVVRECSGGRSLEDVLTDPYVRNRSTPGERGDSATRFSCTTRSGADSVTESRKIRRR